MTWGVDRMVANAGKVTFTIPSCIPAGNYLLRHEMIGEFQDGLLDAYLTIMGFLCSAPWRFNVSRSSILCMFRMQSTGLGSHFFSDGVCSDQDHGGWDNSAVDSELPWCLQRCVSSPRYTINFIHSSWRTGTDPGITVNIYYPPLTNYTIPGLSLCK
jgi:hypothetical protein